MTRDAAASITYCCRNSRDKINDKGTIRTGLVTATVIVRRAALYTPLRLDLSTRVQKWSLHQEQLARALFLELSCGTDDENLCLETRRKRPTS